MRREILLFTAAVIGGSASTAYATGGEIAIQLVEAPGHTSKALPPIAFEVGARDVDDVRIVSSVWTRGRQVLPKHETSVIVVDPETHSKDVTKSLGPNFVRATRGDTFSVPALHAVSLRPDVYAELVQTTVVIHGRSHAIKNSHFRYFEVTSDGLVRMISSERYSAKTTKRFHTADGIPYFDGGAGRVDPQRTPVKRTGRPRAEQMDVRVILKGEDR